MYFLFVFWWPSSSNSTSTPFLPPMSLHKVNEFLGGKVGICNKFLSLTSKPCYAGCLTLHTKIISIHRVWFEKKIPLTWVKFISLLCIIIYRIGSVRIRGHYYFYFLEGADWIAERTLSLLSFLHFFAFFYPNFCRTILQSGLY